MNLVFDKAGVQEPIAQSLGGGGGGLELGLQKNGHEWLVICVNWGRFAINVEVQYKSLAFSLVIALFCSGQGTTGIGNDVVSSCFWICLRENSS